MMDWIIENGATIAVSAVLFAVVALGIIDKPLNFAVNAVADPLMRLGYGLMELILKIFA